MMNKMFRIDEDSIKISKEDFTSIENRDVVKEFFKCRKNSETGNQEFSFYGTILDNKKIFFLDDMLIKDRYSFSNFVEYYQQKTIDENLGEFFVIDYDENSFKIEPCSSSGLFYDDLKDLVKYSSFIGIEGIENVSPFLFEKLKIKHDILNYIQQLLSLILISDRVNVDKEIIQIELKGKFEETREFEIPWREWNWFKNSSIFYDCLKWILYSDSKILGIRQRSTLIKNILVNTLKKDSSNFNEIESNYISLRAEKTLNLIIENKTEDFFKQEASLKSDLYKFYEEENDIFKHIHNSFIGLFGIVSSLIIVNIFVENDFNDVIIKFQNLVFRNILITMLLIGILLITLIFYLDIARYKDYIKNINCRNKEIFGDVRIFDSKDFKTYKFILWLIIISLVIVLIVINIT